MNPEKFRKKKLRNGKRSAAVLLVQCQFARRHFPPVRSRIHVQHFKSLHLDTQESKQTHPETLHLAYSKWLKEHVPNKKTPTLKGRTTNGQNWRHITVYKDCFCYSNLYGVKQKNLLLRTNALPFIRSGTFQKRKIVDQKWWKIRFGSELTNSCCFAMATERWCQDRIVALKYEIKLLDWLKSFYT